MARMLIAAPAVAASCSSTAPRENSCAVRDSHATARNDEAAAATLTTAAQQNSVRE